MKRFLVGALLIGLMTLPAFAALKQGDQAPDFSAKASLAGKEFAFSLKDALKKGPVVVYFYPSAFTADPQYCAGKIAVASDADRTIAKSYNLTKMDLKPGLKDTRGEVIEHEFTERTTFVITSDFKVAATFSTADDKISPAEHVAKSLAVVQQLASARSTKQ